MVCNARGCFVEAVLTAVEGGGAVGFGFCRWWVFWFTVEGLGSLFLEAASCHGSNRGLFPGFQWRYYSGHQWRSIGIMLGQQQGLVSQVPAMVRMFSTVGWRFGHRGFYSSGVWVLLVSGSLGD